jgi:hypothetical protein
MTGPAAVSLPGWLGRSVGWAWSLCWLGHWWAVVALGGWMECQVEGCCPLGGVTRPVRFVLERRRNGGLTEVGSQAVIRERRPPKMGDGL